ncbi:REST [Branchiostoma lanceolatum]|uniref:REST protein n=1 Tax=Branchiostoma lanceolatum TaxID=7740 RepID=A0A8J9VB24_BRALA|nr:REST [Branchiostoma lanceolatum]
MAPQRNPVYQPELISIDTLKAVSKGNLIESSELAQVNDALMQAANTDHGRHPYRYGIASVNFKGYEGGTGNRDLRKRLLSQLQEQIRVSIIFVQECPWADPVKQLQLEEPFCYTGVNNEAGIIWNSDVFELRRLDSYRLIGDKYPYLILHRGRVCVAEMSIKDQPTGDTASSNIAIENEANVSDFIAISWHGPHKSTDAEKQLIFRDLLAFFKTLRVTKHKDDQRACIIGGDFNFSLDKACDNIDDGYPGLAIPTSYGSETIDYFIFTSDLINILHAQQLSLDYDVGSVYTAQDRDRARTETCKTASNIVIDHSPVFAVLDLGSPNPFSSPSKIIMTRKIKEPSRMDITPDCSTEGSAGSGATSGAQISTKNRRDERRPTNEICGLSRFVTSTVVFNERLTVEELGVELRRRDIPVGSNSRHDMSVQLCEEIEGKSTSIAGQGTEMESDLSREVSLAVLPRLHENELRWELKRRKITSAAEDSQDGLMKRLCDEMGKEYFGQQASAQSFENNARNTPTKEAPNVTTTEQTIEAAPMQEVPFRATGTTDEKSTLQAPSGAKGIGGGELEERRGKGHLHNVPSKAAGKGDELSGQQWGTSTYFGAGSSMPSSPSTSSNAAVKRKLETQVQETSKRSDTGNETTRKYSAVNVATTIYITYIRPVIDYAAPVWQSGLPASLSNKIEKVQRRALRIILGADFTSYSKACERLDLPTLQTRRQELTVKFARTLEQSKLY